MKTNSKIILTGFLIAMFAISCESPTIELLDDGATKKSGTVTGLSIPTSEGGITPWNIVIDGQGGTRTCEQVAEAFGCSYENTSERFKDGKQFSGSVGPIEWKTDLTGTFVTWSSSVPIKVAVIVKGGNHSNIYYYGCESSDCVTGDAGLASPPYGAVGPPYNANDELDQLLSIIFCWTVCDEAECEWVGETAWAEGNRYVTRGNWATYTSYYGVSKSAVLYAGQILNAGTVDFSDPVDGKVTITINLNAGWRFGDDDENVKIQDYASTPPARNPAIGRFDHKGFADGSTYSIEVPENNYYGIHVDVEWKKCE